LKLAGEYSVADVALSPDGKRLYFCSDMPTFWENARGFDIWYVERTKSGWSEPVNAGKNINTVGGETQPSFTTDGSMYFPSWPTDSNEGCPAVTPDGKYFFYFSADLRGEVPRGSTYWVDVKSMDDL
jgi:hypothetical protein